MVPSASATLDQPSFVFAIIDSFRVFSLSQLGLPPARYERTTPAEVARVPLRSARSAVPVDPPVKLRRSFCPRLRSAFFGDLGSRSPPTPFSRKREGSCLLRAMAEQRLNEGATLPLGAAVMVHARTLGWVRFVGTTEFGLGEWVGIELSKVRKHGSL